MDVAFHPRQDLLAVVKLDEPVELWQLPQGTLLRQLGTLGHDALAFSPCGRWTVISARVPDQMLPGEFYRGATHLYGRTLNSPTVLRWETDTTYAFHPSERLLVAGWNDQGGGEVRLAKLATPVRKSRNTLEAPGWVQGLRFGPRGALLAVVGGAPWAGEFCLEVYECAHKRLSFWEKRLTCEWHAPAGEEVDYGLAWPEQVGFSPDGTRLYYPGPCGELIDVEVQTGNEKQRSQAHRRMVTTLDTDWQSRFLISGSRDGMMALWKVGWAA
jgi:WD40 repeat protein